MSQSEIHLFKKEHGLYKKKKKAVFKPQFKRKKIKKLKKLRGEGVVKKQTDPVEKREEASLGLGEKRKMAAVIDEYIVEAKVTKKVKRGKQKRALICVDDDDDE